MPHTSELFRQIRETVLRHVYERQVVAGKWGVDFFWARKDIARILSRPGQGTRTLSSTPASVRSRRFDWGFEVTFEHVIEHLAEEDLLEVRMTSALAAGRGNTLRIRDYKLTDAGIAHCDDLFGPPLPGESDVATRLMPAPDGDGVPDAEPASDSGAAVQLPDLPDKPDDWDESEETAEIDMELALRAAKASGESGDAGNDAGSAGDSPMPAGHDVHGVNAETKPVSDVDVTEMPGTRKLADPAALAANDAAASGRRSDSRRDSPSGRHPAVS